MMHKVVMLDTTFEWPRRAMHPFICAIVHLGRIKSFEIQLTTHGFHHVYYHTREADARLHTVCPQLSKLQACTFRLHEHCMHDT